MPAGGTGHEAGTMPPTTVRALAAATPADRNRVVDFLRVLAILVVVLGHWLLAAVVVRDGVLVPDAVLNLATWSHPLTWVFQVMPVFFLVGGYANARSWRSARASAAGYPAWLRARIRRLVTPVVPLLVTWLVLVTIGYAAHVPWSALRTASQVALVPTWFLAAYVLVVAVAPGTLWLWERFGWATVAVGLLLGGAVDAVSIGRDDLLVGFANYLVVWATVHQLGYALLDHRLDGPARRATLAALGLAGLVALVRFGPYPVSIIGVDGAGLNNSYPTRVTLAFLGMFQAGVLLLAERRLETWLHRDRPWKATVLVSARIMTLYLWHLTAMVLVIGVGVLLGGFGLHAEPLSALWWATRPLWYAVLVVVTLGLVAVYGRFERPVVEPRSARPVRPARPAARRSSPSVWQPLAATALACGGLGVMAAQGVVGPAGVRWWWPMLPILGAALVAPRPWTGRA